MKHHVPPRWSAPGAPLGPGGAARRIARSGAGYLAAVLLVGITAAIRWAVEPAMGDGAAVAFVPAVALAAWTCGLGPGLVATATAAAALGQPRSHQAALAELVVAGVAVTLLLAARRSPWRSATPGPATGEGDAQRQAEEEFWKVTEALPVILWVADPAGGIQFVNRAYRAFFGITLEAVEGKRWLSLLHPDDAARYLEAFHCAVEERGPYSLEARVRRADGRWRHVVSHGEARRSAQGDYLGHLGISLDVTEQRALAERLQQSRRLESVGRLAGGVAHDFRNLLTVILSYAESLGEDASHGAPAQREAVLGIQAAGARAAELTGQLLAFARKQVTAPVRLDLNDVLRRNERSLRQVLGERVELVTRLQPGLWTVRCDVAQLEQVVLNLALNARDAMPRGGQLTVETSNVPVEEGQAAEPPFAGAGPYVRLAVRDTGEGMSPEVKTHVFEPFFTTKPDGRGTGLGLATVYGIVKQSEGHIHLESEPGRGTSFELYFPAEIGGAGAPPDAPRPGARV
jgi:PAS domain S-box-containing protein